MNVLYHVFVFKTLNHFPHNFTTTYLFSCKFAFLPSKCFKKCENFKFRKTLPALSTENYHLMNEFLFFDFRWPSTKLWGASQYYFFPRYFRKIAAIALFWYFFVKILWNILRMSYFDVHCFIVWYLIKIFQLCWHKIHNNMLFLHELTLPLRSIAKFK